MYYFDLHKCKYKNYPCKYLKEECENIISPYIKKISNALSTELKIYWTTRTTFGFVLCDYKPEYTGAKLISKGAKRLFELVKDDIDFLVLSSKSEKLSHIMNVEDKKVLVIHIGNFKWFLRTFSNQKNAVNLLLNKFSHNDAKIILKWFRSSIGKLNIEEVKQVTVDAKGFNEETIVRAVGKNPSLMLKLAKQIESSDFDITTVSDFSAAIYRIENLINTKNVDKLKELIETLKDEDPLHIDKLNEHLKHVTLNSINRTIAITRENIESLNQFKSMLENPNTYEVKGYGSTSVHEFLEDNPWFMGKKYELFKSEKKIKQIVKTKLPKKIANLKPDFVLLKRRDNQSAIVLEIKRPNISLGVKDVQQVLDYKNILKKYMPNIKSWTSVLVGKSLSTDLESRKEDYNIEIKTYIELYGDCEDDLNDYLEVYEEKKKELSQEKKEKK
jgi:hypothetical protein